MSKSLVLLASCELAHGVAQGKCAWCGAELPSRRRTWCSDRCGDAFWANHWWSVARRTVRRRDRYRCTRCGHKPPGRTHPKYRTLRKTDRLEVNHITPALGDHRRLSCAHHLENLETLCLACHQTYTSSQQRQRRAARTT